MQLLEQRNLSHQKNRLSAPITPVVQAKDKGKAQRKTHIPLAPVFRRKKVAPKEVRGSTSTVSYFF